MKPSNKRAGGPRRRRGPRNASRRDGARGAKSVEPLHPVADPPDVESFEHWDLGEDIQAAIAAMGIVKPTPIQALAIGDVLDGRDVIAKAETGTGKTLAFGAPMMARVDVQRSSVLGLVLCPTRELSEQVHNVLVELAGARGLRTVLIVGGEDMVPQVRGLQAGAQVVVGTPGRILDLMNQGFLSFPWTEFAVLDEADKMLEIGFIDDVKKILEACNEYRQTLLFSATFPPPLLKLAREYTRDPVEVATASGVSTVDTISQYFLRVNEDSRARALSAVIDGSGDDDVFLVFCDRRTDVDRLMRRMERERFSVKALHGGYDQASRFRVMSAFRTGEVKALVATDVASRGLDVAHVTHVVNYGVPRDASDYTHRIGRTGRAGREGTALTLVGPENERNWRSLLRAVPFEIEELNAPRELYTARRKSRSSGDEGEERDESKAGRSREGREQDRERSRPRRKRDERDAQEDRPRRKREPKERREEEPKASRSEVKPSEVSRSKSGRSSNRRSDEDRARPSDPRPKSRRASDDRDPRRESRRREDSPKTREGQRGSGDEVRESAPGFGAGLKPAEAPATETPRESKPKRQRRPESSQPESSQKETSEPPGFGAGI